MAGPVFSRGAAVSGLVTQMMVATLVGAWGGSELDQRLGTEPWLLFVGVTLGFVLGIVSLGRGLERLQTIDEGDEPPNPS